MTTVTSMWVAMGSMMCLLAKLPFHLFFILKENQPASKLNIICWKFKYGVPLGINSKMETGKASRSWEGIRCCILRS